MRDRLIWLLEQANEVCAKRFREETKAVLKQKGCFNSKTDRAENFNEITADYLIENGVIVPPCGIEDTVYHITKCGGFHGELDGTLYDSNGGLGTATGYYCPCELRDNCPFDYTEDFDCNQLQNKMAIFEDTVKGILINDCEEILFLEYSGDVYIRDFGKTVFLTKEEAEEALKESESK